VIQSPFVDQVLVRLCVPRLVDELIHVYCRTCIVFCIFIFSYNVAVLHIVMCMCQFIYKKWHIIPWLYLLHSVLVMTNVHIFYSL